MSPGGFQGAGAGDGFLVLGWGHPIFLALGRRALGAWYRGAWALVGLGTRGVSWESCSAGGWRLCRGWYVPGAGSACDLYDRLAAGCVTSSVT